MPSVQDPNLGLYYGWSYGESGWNTGLDANLKKLGALAQLSVKSRTTDVPGAPANGDRYIIPTGATGDWSGKDGQVAVRIAGAWEYYPPAVGWLAFVEDEDVISVYKSAGWSTGVAI